jgi:xylulokinase
LAEPCTIAGPLTADAAQASNLTSVTDVNIGTLDHFTGMIGTGNVTLGGMTLSTGTVMALTTMSAEPAPRDSGIAMHYGFTPDTHIMLPVAESGGVSLEWFRRTCMGDVGYDEMNQVLAQRQLPNNLIFLPYLVGTNSPEFDVDASGTFFGLRQENDVFDMACAVMEGVAFMLRKNCDHIRSKGTTISHIIATGGGSKSPIWCQLQADITGLPVVIPAEKEAACLGCAIVGAVSDGVFDSYADAAKKCITFTKRYEPVHHSKFEKKYEKFCALYEAMLKVTRL